MGRGRAREAPAEEQVREVLVCFGGGGGGGREGPEGRALE